MALRTAVMDTTMDIADTAITATLVTGIMATGITTNHSTVTAITVAIPATNTTQSIAGKDGR